MHNAWLYNRAVAIEIVTAHIKYGGSTIQKKVSRLPGIVSATGDQMKEDGRKPRNRGVLVLYWV